MYVRGYVCVCYPNDKPPFLSSLKSAAARFFLEFFTIVPNNGARRLVFHARPTPVAVEIVCCMRIFWVDYGWGEGAWLCTVVFAADDMVMM